MNTLVCNFFCVAHAPCSVLWCVVVLIQVMPSPCEHADIFKQTVPMRQHCCSIKAQRVRSAPDAAFSQSHNTALEHSCSMFKSSKTTN